MSRKKPTTNLLIDETASFARRLLKRASETRIGTQAEGEEAATPAVDLDTQTAVLSVVTRWVATQFKIAPDREDDSEFERLRGRLGVGTKRGKSVGGAGGPAASAKNGTAAPTPRVIGTIVARDPNDPYVESGDD